MLGDHAMESCLIFFGLEKINVWKWYSGDSMRLEMSERRESLSSK